MVEPERQADALAAARAYEQYMVPSLFGPWVDDVLAAATLSSGERVLDVACGTGAATRVAAARVMPGGSATGLDIDTGMVEVARGRSSSAGGTPIAWHVASALDMPFQDAAFDVVVCLQGVQYFPDRLAGFKEMRRVLTSSGRIAVSAWLTIDQCKGHAALAKVMDRHRIDSQPARRPFSLGEAGASKQHIHDEISARIGYDLDRTVTAIRPGYSFDVAAERSVPEAIICFLDAQDFEGAVRNAVSLGGDADTIACIAGAIAEAHWGGCPSRSPGK